MERQEWIQSSAYADLPLLLFIYFSNKARLLPAISDPSTTGNEE